MMRYLFHRISAVLIGTVLAAIPIQLTAAQEAQVFPTVKSAGLEPNLRVPWSEPVRVTDPFEGNFLAVFDRHDLQDSRSRKVISLWSRDSIRVLLTNDRRRCGLGLGVGIFHWETACLDGSYSNNTVRQLFVKVGDRVLELAGTNGKFEVSDEVAGVLKNAPEQNVDIRLVLEGGETADSEIGKGTVKAWRAIY